MKDKILFLIPNCLLALFLLLSCTPGGIQEEDVGVIDEKEEMLPAEKEINISTVLQEGNDLPKIQLVSNTSSELPENRIGDMFGLRRDIRTQRDAVGLIDRINTMGFKWVRLSLDYFDWSEIVETGEFSRFYIDPIHKDLINGMTDNGIKVMYCLVFWDDEITPSPGYARFKTEEEITRYIDYVRFIVRNLKDEIEYYEILNETFFSEYSDNTQQNIEINDYINLVKRIVPVIRAEDADAKIVAGPAPGIHDADCRDYFFEILQSEIMLLVDAVAWHPGPYCLEYEELDEYFNEYPSIVQKIKNVAGSHGFNGEFIAEEIQWRTRGNQYEPWTFSETVAAKYYARGIVMHLGMNVTSGVAGSSHLLNIPKMSVIRNLCTVMAGAECIDLPIELQSNEENILYYGFALPDGEKLLALWVNGMAADYNDGVNSTITLLDSMYQKVVAIDVLKGFKQELVKSVENDSMVIENVLIRDYPVILRLIP